MASKPDRRLRRVCALAVLPLALAPAAAAPGSPAAELVEQARASYRAGEHFAALDQAQRTLSLYPTDSAALALKGQLVRDAQGPVAALPLLEQAIEAAPGNVDLLGEYAATLAEAGRHQDMLTVVRRMVELDAANPRAYFLQAVLAARAGRDNLARRLLWRIRGEDDPAPATVLLDGVLELRSGSAAQAVERFAALTRRQPDNRTAQLLLGRALLANGEANEVVARLAARADRPDASPYLLTLVGRAYEELGQRDLAAVYLDRAAGPAPAGAWPLPVSAERELAAWRWEDDPLRPQAAVTMLRDLLVAGQSAQAHELAAQLSARYRGSADVARLAGDVELLTGGPEQALASYQRAGAVRTDFALVQRIVAAERTLGRDDRAEARLARRLALNPRETDTAILLARVAFARGDWSRAALLLDRPGLRDDPRALAMLAVARLEGGEAAGAVEPARRAYTLQRGNGSMARVLAQVLRASGGFSAEAQALLAKAERLSPTVLAQR